MTLPGSVKQSSSDLLTSFRYAADATPPKNWERPTCLYRFFDSRGDLLYLGITSRLHIRMTEHGRDYAGTWWPLVASRTVKWFETRAEASQAERKAITAEKPPHNVLHTPRSRAPLGQHKGGPIKKPSSERGRHLLSIIRTSFSEQAFTQADLRAVSRQSPSATTKNVRALASQGVLAVVGTRRVRGYTARPHVLYALPEAGLQDVHQVVDPEVPRPRRSRKGDQLPTFLEQARGHFGARPFTAKELAKAIGAQPRYTKNRLNRLCNRGDVVCSGSRPNGAMPANLYVIPSASRPRMVVRAAEVTR